MVAAGKLVALMLAASVPSGCGAGSPATDVAEGRLIHSAGPSRVTGQVDLGRPAAFTARRRSLEQRFQRWCRRHPRRCNRIKRNAERFATGAMRKPHRNFRHWRMSRHVRRLYKRAWVRWYHQTYGWPCRRCATHAPVFDPQAAWHRFKSHRSCAHWGKPYPPPARPPAAYPYCLHDYQAPPVDWGKYWNNTSKTAVACGGGALLALRPSHPLVMMAEGVAGCAWAVFSFWFLTQD